MLHGLVECFGELILSCEEVLGMLPDSSFVIVRPTRRYRRSCSFCPDVRAERGQWFIGAIDLPVIGSFMKGMFSLHFSFRPRAAAHGSFFVVMFSVPFSFVI